MNEDQVAFWNAGPGANWAAHADELDALHAEVQRLLLSRIGAVTGTRIADIGCGAGALSRALADSAGPGGEVLGLDVSAPLLEVARARAGDRATLRLETGDAQAYPFRDDALDLVTSRFGTMFFDDPAAAFRNLARALRPGGRMVFVAWAEAPANPWFSAAAEVARAHLGVPAPPSAPPMTPGPTAFRDAGRVLSLLADAGLESASADRQQTTLSHPGGAAGAAELARHIGPAPGQVRDHGGRRQDLDTIVARLRERFATWEGPDGLRIPATVLVFTAHRPA